MMHSATWRTNVVKELPIVGTQADAPDLCFPEETVPQRESKDPLLSPAATKF